MFNIITSFFKTQMYRNGNKIAVCNFETKETLTFSDLEERSIRIANFLLSKVKIKKGDRIGILSKNHPVYIDLFYSLIYTGGIISSYSTYLEYQDLKKLIINEEPKVIFFEEEFIDIIERIRKLEIVNHYVLISNHENKLKESDFWNYKKIVENYDSSVPTIQNLRLEDIGLLMHTGGTTGIPKAAKISYKSIIFNAIGQENTWDLTSKDSTIAYLPMFHTGTWNTIVIPILYAGGLTIIMNHFDPLILSRTIEKEKVSVLWGVPTVYQRISELKDFEKFDFSSLRLCRCGASTPTLRVMQAFWNKGILFCNGYGMTETSPGTLSMPIASMSLEEVKKKRLSCGKLMPYNEAKVIDKQGRDVKEGEAGELLIRGELLFSGYWENPAETKEVLREGWMHTGDIVKIDSDGFFYIIGRRKNCYISNGENIYPFEVERTFLEYPGIKDVCIFGVADDEKGEVGKALLVVESSRVDKEKLYEFIKENISSLKIPKYITFIDKIPKNSLGKKDINKIRNKYGKANMKDLFHIKNQGN